MLRILSTTGAFLCAVRNSCGASGKKRKSKFEEEDAKRRHLCSPIPKLLPFKFVVLQFRGRYFFI